jgi:hypothetical protein
MMIAAMITIVHSQPERLGQGIGRLPDQTQPQVNVELLQRLLVVLPMS